MRQAWSHVDVQLQRRADLIPNLVATTRGYAQHEASVFESVAAARAAVLNAGTPADRMAANAKLDGALGRLLALAARYPELKASGTFLGLQAQLDGTENRIAVARLRYNASLQDYNAYIKRFPTVLVARASGFQHNSAYFDVARGAAQTARTDVPLGAEHRAPAP